eukprot:1061527-Prymnesium_polylepis.1
MRPCSGSHPRTSPVPVRHVPRTREAPQPRLDTASRRTKATGQRQSSAGRYAAPTQRQRHPLRPVVRRGRADARTDRLLLYCLPGCTLVHSRALPVGSSVAREAGVHPQRTVRSSRASGNVAAHPDIHGRVSGMLQQAAPRELTNLINSGCTRGARRHSLRRIRTRPISSWRLTFSSATRPPVGGGPVCFSHGSASRVQWLRPRLCAAGCRIGAPPMRLQRPWKQFLPRVSPEG